MVKIREITPETGENEAHISSFRAFPGCARVNTAEGEKNAQDAAL